MHPLINSTSKVLILLVGWLLLSGSVGGLISVSAGASIVDCLILFIPLYFLCLIFILPNYYVCRGLPLRQTSWVTLLSSHALMLIVIVAMWVFAGRAYAAFLDSGLEPARWYPLFEQSLTINLAIVVLQFEIVVLIHYLFFAMEKTRDLEKAALQQKLLISQAELQTLKATVHPHFLFNSLNTLSNIALSAPEQAHRFCLLIAEFLRYSVAYSKKSSATLSEELEHIQNYLGIERERFGDRLQTEFNIEEDARELVVPPLILFPVVENAIKHGIDSCIEGGLVSIVTRQNAGMLIIEVTNPVDELGRKLRGTGHGLASVQQRLKNSYGETALLKTTRQAGQFTAQIYLPVDKPGELNSEDLPEQAIDNSPALSTNLEHVRKSQP
jgi:two-component system LytT family sensor kinase